MNIKRWVTKNALLNIILGVVIIAFAVVAMFFTSLIKDFLAVLVGVIILYLTALRVYQDIHRYKSSQALFVVIVEFVIAVVAAYFLIVQQASIARYLGIVLYTRGFVILFIAQLFVKKLTFQRFAFAMAFLTLGAYVWFGNNAYETQLQWVLFVSLVLYGVLLLVEGLKEFKKS